MKTLSLAASVALVALFAHPAFAASDADVNVLRQDMQAMKQAYEQRMQELENKLKTMEEEQQATSAKAVAPLPLNTNRPVRRTIYDSSFNPSIGVVVNGQYNAFSADENEIEGFAVGHEGERPREGFAVDHTELNFSANVDDKFTGSATLAIADHEGETELELEEAFVQTAPGIGLPSGMTVKAGRAFWTLGYLNEHHSHADDFADRPLPYRVFLDEGFNDDGAEISYVLPAPFYAEVGGGVFRGDDTPFGGASGDGVGAWSAYGRVGGDIGTNQSWRAGLATLSGSADEGRVTNEDEVTFIGDSNLYVAEARYTWAPTGNARQREFTLQGEYFHRTEDGTYEDAGAGTGAVAFDDDTSGWYAQGVYKFHPQWRVGARYSMLHAADTPAGLVGTAMDADGHDPSSYSTMLDWTNSEFSRVRAQYNYEKPNRNTDDHQFTLQYIMSLGAHGAHKY